MPLRLLFVQDRGRFCVTDTRTHLDLFVRDTEPSPVLTVLPV